MWTKLLSALLLAVLLHPAHAAKLYRWVDENGKVHYSDQVPPEHARQARDELNEQGITVDSVESAPSPEQMEAARAQARKEAEERKEKEEQRRRDRVLLNSYTSVADIERAREKEIAAVQSTVDMTRAAQESQRRQIAKLVHRAAELERSGQQVSQELLADMEDVREKIQDRADYIEEKRTEQARIYADYEQDLARYRELMEEGEEEDEG